MSSKPQLGYSQTTPPADTVTTVLKLPSGRVVQSPSNIGRAEAEPQLRKIAHACGGQYIGLVDVASLDDQAAALDAQHGRADRFE